MRSFPTLVLAGVVAVGLTSAGPRVPEVLSDMERFRVRHVEIGGMRFLERADVEAVLDLPPGASVWDDHGPWTARLASHPLVRTAAVERRLPSTLVVTLEERTPVALLASPTLTPVDAEGRSLPLDPATHRLDLPLLRVPASPARLPVAPSWNDVGDRPDGAKGSPGVEGWTASPPSRPVRVLAGEAARLSDADPAFGAMLSELEWDRRDAVVARLGSPSVDLRFRAPLTPRRLQEAMAVLDDARTRNPRRTVRLVDLRFADQVVVSFADEGIS